MAMASLVPEGGASCPAVSQDETDLALEGCAGFSSEAVVAVLLGDSVPLSSGMAMSQDAVPTAGGVGDGAGAGRALRTGARACACTCAVPGAGAVELSSLSGAMSISGENGLLAKRAGAGAPTATLSSITSRARETPLSILGGGGSFPEDVPAARGCRGPSPSWRAGGTDAAEADDGRRRTRGGVLFFFAASVSAGRRRASRPIAGLGGTLWRF